MEELIDISGAQTLVGISIGAVVSVITAYKGIILDAVKTFVQNKKIYNIKLENHTFFTRIHKYIVYDIDLMVFHDTNKVRNAMTKHFVMIKMQEYEAAFKELVAKDIMKMTPQNLSKEVVDIMINIWKQYDDRAIAEGVPKEFIDKYNEKRKELAKQCFRCADSYFQSPLTGNNVLSMMRVLDMLVFVFDSVIIDAETTIACLNGELDDLTYKGERVGKGKKNNYLYDNGKGNTH